MKMLKQILRLSVISLVILFVVVTVVSFIFPSAVVVSRAVNINASSDKIFNEINDFNRWKEWMTGLNDSSLKIQSVNKAVIGNTIVTLSILDSTKVNSLWENSHHKMMLSNMNLISNSSTSNLTVVQWQFVQKLKWYPWEKFGSLLNDKILGTMMESNLNKLKEICEQ